MNKTCVVIPCYNEADRFPLEEYNHFLNQEENLVICFVNDGSKDDTLSCLEKLKTTNNDKVYIVSNNKNIGKAEAVRTGVNYCLGQNDRFDFIGYLDADLATPLIEFKRLTAILIKNKTLQMSFGSRMQRIGATINRSGKRHYIGRFIATIISLILKLNVYDTQCGCKIFTRDVAKKIFVKAFISTWLFDVEIFARIINVYGRKETLNKIIEVPLNQWIDKGKSKVRPSYFFKIWIDLYQINKFASNKN